MQRLKVFQSNDKLLQKTMTSSYQMELKILIEASFITCTLEQKFFAAAIFEGLRVVLFQCTLVCMILHCICREDTTKQILFMRSKFDFLHVDI